MATITSSSPKELLQKAKSYANADSSDYFANVAKGTVNGAVTGGFIAAIFGYYKGFNVYASLATGIIVGAITSNLLIKYKN